MGLPFRVLPPPGLLTLGLVAATLAGIIRLELREGAPEDTSAPVAPARQQSAAASVSRLGNDSGNQVARQVAIILGRPLFSPSRRPENATPVRAQGRAPDLARLSGIMTSPAGKSAIFAGPVDGKPIVLGEGAHIGEYVVKSIDVGAVVITGPSGERVLHPAFDPSPPPRPVIPPSNPPPIPLPLPPTLRGSSPSE